MATTTVTARVDSELTNQAGAVLAEIGLTLDDAVGLLLRHIASPSLCISRIRTRLTQSKSPKHRTESATTLSTICFRTCVPRSPVDQRDRD